MTLTFPSKHSTRLLKRTYVDEPIGHNTYLGNLARLENELNKGRMFSDPIIMAIEKVTIELANIR